MDRDDLRLRERIKEILETYSFEDILEENGDSLEDIICFLYFEYGLKLPEMEPL